MVHSMASCGNPGGGAGGHPCTPHPPPSTTGVGQFPRWAPPCTRMPPSRPLLAALRFVEPFASKWRQFLFRVHPDFFGAAQGAGGWGTGEGGNAERLEDTLWLPSQGLAPNCPPLLAFELAR